MTVPSAPSGGRGRFQELDGLRGIAVTAVLLYHYTWLFDAYYPGAAALPWSFPLGHYGVQLFFMVSGFVILLTARGTKSPAHFLIARFSRLYPPYWVALTITIVVGVVAGLPSLIGRPLDALVNYTMFQRLLRVKSVDGAYWSLSVELLFYGLVYLVMRVRGQLSDTHVRTLAATWSAGSLLIAGASQLVTPGALDFVIVLTATEYAALFSVGMLVFLSRTTGRSEPLLPAIMVLGASTSLVVNGWQDAVVNVVLMVFFTAVCLVPSVPALRWRPLVWVGAISYPLYLVHQNLGYALTYHLTPVAGRPIAFLTSVATAVGLAYLIHIWVELPVSRAWRRSLSAWWDRRSREAPT